MADARILMVEGTDDQHVVMNICSHYNIPPLLTIEHYGNVDEVINAILPRLRQAREVGDVIGILVDADESAQNRWQAIRQRILAAGYADVPEQLPAGGVIIEPPADTILPRAGVWIMPDNRAPGILEDFLRFMAPTDSALFQYAEACVDGIPPAERWFRDVDRPKALMHTWLAWQETPGRPFGTAITAQFLDPAVPETAAFAGWIRSLFFAGTD